LQVFGLHQDGDQYPLFKLKKGSSPPKLYNITSNYLNIVKNKLSSAISRTHYLKKDYFVKEIERFASWASGSIIVKPADKNLGLTVMTCQTYVALCSDYLVKTCSPIRESEDLVLQYLRNITTEMVQLHSKVIDTDVSKYLMKNELEVKKLACFYGLPKMYKHPVGLRPIVVLHSSPFSTLSVWLGKVLHPCVIRLSQHLRDSSELTQVLASTPFPSSVKLLTFDVESMYPSMTLLKA
jgi:hypothetical protein